MFILSKIRKCIFLLGILLAVGQGFASNCAADYVPPENLVWDGTSTEEPCTIGEYYIIDNAAKLAWFAAQTNTVDNNQYLSKNAKLMADLDMGGKLWTPIAVGDGHTGKRIFSGIFDGNYHSISNLYISAEDLITKYAVTHNDSIFYAQNLGFIGCFKGTLKNLNIIDIEVHGFGKGGLNDKNKIVEKPISIGTLVGWQSTNGSLIDGCTASGVVVTSGDGQAVGGIVGNIGGGSISNCVSTVSIKASGLAYVGGIAGYTKKYENAAVTVSSCVYAGTELSAEGSAVVGGKTYNSAAGAIVGHQYQSNLTISNVFYDEDEFGKAIGASTGGTTNNTSATGVPDVNSEDVVCPLNGGTMNDGECSKDSPWSVGESSVSLNGSDGFTVTFNAKSGAFPDGAKKKKIILKDKIITPEEISAPIHADSAFAGWSLNPEATEPDDDLGSVSGSATVYAVWYPIFTITFSAAPGTYADGKTVVKTVKVAKGDMISVTGMDVPTTYVRNDSTLYFTGWSDVQKEFKVDDDIASSDTLHLDGLVATGNMTFYAAWTKARTFTVTYNANGHGKTKIDFVNVERGETLTEPPAPTPDNGYEYSGWCLDTLACNSSTHFVFETTPIDTNYVLYADWNAIIYSITYNLDGGTNNAGNPATYTIEEASIVLQDPVKEGNNFKGWFYDDNFDEIAKQITSGSTGNKVLYAKWEEKTYTITYMAGSGAVGSISPAQKGYGMSITLAEGGHYTRDGFTQDGWATEDGGDRAYVLGANYSNNADITLYPHWVQGNVEITSYGAVTIYTYADSHKEAVINGEYSGTDEYSLDEDVSVNSVVLDRSFTPYVPVTMTLPFDIAVENVENAKFYVFGGVSVDGNGKKAVEANRVKTGILEANTPYMVIPMATSITFNGAVVLRETIEPVTQVGNWEFVGTYAYKTVAEENQGAIYGFAGSAEGEISQGQFARFAAGAHFVAMRAYLLNTEISNRRLAKSLYVRPASTEIAQIGVNWNENEDNVPEEQTTTVRRVMKAPSIQKTHRVFDLKGRFVNEKSKSKGVYFNR